MRTESYKKEVPFTHTFVFYEIIISNYSDLFTLVCYTFVFKEMELICIILIVWSTAAHVVQVLIY